MKYIILIEMPTEVDAGQRMAINRELKRLAYECPKRNVFLLEVDDETMIKKIKEHIIKDSSPRSKVNFYRLHEI